MEHALECALDHGLNIGHVNEGHFHIQLSELRLTVGAGVLVAEAARDLIILIKACQHKQLLIYLRRLRQGVELARMHAAGYEVVARALGGGLGKYGGFYLGEALLIHIIADGIDYAVAHTDGALQRRTAQVEIAILEAHSLGLIGVIVDVDGRGFALIEQRSLFDEYFDVAGIQLGVFHALFAGANLAADAYHVFAAQAFAQFEAFLAANALIEHNLNQTAAVAQPYEYQSTQIAGALHPAVQSNRLTHVRRAQFAAIAGALPILYTRHSISPSYLIAEYQPSIFLISAATSARAMVCSSDLAISLILTTP